MSRLGFLGGVLLCATAAPLDVSDAAATAAYAFNRTMLLGKVARRTLLPGQTIPTAAVGEPKVVAIGSRVRLVYQENGLLISTYGSALQAGAVGDAVSVRNLESGITVGGTVAGDGSVHISGDQAGAG